ncbi:VAMP711 protein [Hibiscus syriacus]|uniref:VAMP711 protein n=1 Tax=Hibiscus syriacus TaxID=106335 RepID=A0A6A2Z953_HIBSY|nr:VAMP711 protein [Hibiscus syriacus]
MADNASGGRIPFAFLEDIHQRFVKTYGGAIQSALPYAMNEEFSRVMSQQMDRFSSDPIAGGEDDFNAGELNSVQKPISSLQEYYVVESLQDNGDIDTLAFLDHRLCHRRIDTK